MTEAAPDQDALWQTVEAAMTDARQQQTEVVAYTQGTHTANRRGLRLVLHAAQALVTAQAGRISALEARIASLEGQASRAARASATKARKAR